MARPRTGVTTRTLTVNAPIALVQEIDEHLAHGEESRSGWIKRLIREALDRAQ